MNLMKQLILSTTLINIGLNAIWLNYSVADESISKSAEKTQQPPTHQASEAPPQPSELTQQSQPKKIVPSNEKQLLGKMPVLEKTIANYVSAWKKQDFKTMHLLENWEGGEKLNEVKYIQSFNANFEIHDWKITKIELVENDEYKVLILISHNLPKHIMELVSDNKTVRSTLVQWWKKQDDKFVHLFNLERERLLRSHVPPEPSSPSAQ